MIIDDRYIIIVGETSTGKTVYIKGASFDGITDNFTREHLIPIQNFDYIEYLYHFRRAKFRFTYGDQVIDLVPQTIKIKTVTITLSDMKPDSGVKLKMLTNGRNSLTLIEQQLNSDGTDVSLLQRLTD